MTNYTNFNETDDYCYETNQDYLTWNGKHKGDR